VSYYIVEPEVAGGFGERTVLDASMHPPRVSRLHYEFEGWLGDELLTAFPVYIVTERARRALEALGATGIELDTVEVSTSPTFEDMYPGRALPEFLWMKVRGAAGVDDFGMSADHRLVVSQRALDALGTLTRQAVIRPYPVSPATG
jgi:hypothetical protein